MIGRAINPLPSNVLLRSFGPTHGVNSDCKPVYRAHVCAEELSDKTLFLLHPKSGLTQRSIYTLSLCETLFVLHCFLFKAMLFIHGCLHYVRISVLRFFMFYCFRSLILSPDFGNQAPGQRGLADTSR